MVLWLGLIGGSCVVRNFYSQVFNEWMGLNALVVSVHIDRNTKCWAAMTLLGGMMKRGGLEFIQIVGGVQSAKSKIIRGL